MTTMTCEMFDERLAALLEGELPAAERAAVERHAEGCGRCGPLLADLRDIVRGAAALPALTPSRDLWPAIAGRIEAPVVALEHRQASAVVRRGPSWRVAAAAAAVLVAGTAITTWQLAGGGANATGPAERVATADTPRVFVPAPDSQPGIPATVVAAPADPRQLPPSTVADRGRATAPAPVGVRNAGNSVDVTGLFDREIASLRRTLDTRRAELDTATVRVLEENLTIIDRAIEQSRQALARDPNSSFLVEHLNSALGRKVELLRTATLLPSSS